MAAPVLSAQGKERIERAAAKYPPERRQSAVMAALAIAQDEHGWLPSEAMEEVARVLGMPAVLVRSLDDVTKALMSRGIGARRGGVVRSNSD